VLELPLVALLVRVEPAQVPRLRLALDGDVTRESRVRIAPYTVVERRLVTVGVELLEHAPLGVVNVRHRWHAALIGDRGQVAVPVVGIRDVLAHHVPDVR